MFCGEELELMNKDKQILISFHLEWKEFQNIISVIGHTEGISQLGVDIDTLK